MTQWYSTKEVADRYGVTDRAVRQWIDMGLLPGAEKVGPFEKSDWKVPDTALESLDARRAAVAQPSKKS